jgi:hypothetical protein
MQRLQTFARERRDRRRDVSLPCVELCPSARRGERPELFRRRRAWGVGRRDAPNRFYFSNAFYFYGGAEGAGHTFQLGTKLVAGVKGDAELYLPTLVWVTPAALFGGNFGLTLSEPVGRTAASVSATLTGPRAF